MNMSVATEKPELIARPDLPRDLRPSGIVALALGLVASTWIAASSWKQVRMKPVVRKIDVTGSAKKRNSNFKVCVKLQPGPCL